MAVTRTARTALAAVAAITVLAATRSPGAAAARVPAFPAGARVSYQLGGSYPPPAGVGVVDRDGSAGPAPGRWSICYLNAFQTQPDQLRWWRTRHPALLLHDAAGHEVVDRQWGETLLDTRRPVRLLAVLGPQLDRCARVGFQGVELDNLDSYTRSRHLLTAADAVRYARMLTDRAHRDGLAAAQKNAAELAAQRRRTGFDFAVAEECQVYRECGSYTAAYGRGVVEIEYTDNGRRAFQQACAIRGRRVSVVLRDRDVVPAGAPGHVERWCPAGS